MPTVQFNPDLLTKYNRAVPRYTSYPPATELTETFDQVDFRAAIALDNHKQTPISLYCHIPFCDSICYFCGCNTIITQRKEVVVPYLDYVARHIDLVAPLVSPKRLVQQMHWGGGTPNYLSIEQVEALWAKFQQSFTFTPDAEISIEVNPRQLSRDYVFALRKLGFNRISFGIQDFDPQVQAAVNRIQPEEMLFEAMGWLREAGFDSINVDLIYGLPYQTRETFQTTIEKTLQLNPDRIAVFNFAYIPWLKPVQKKMPVEALPSAATKLEMLHLTIDELTTHGYVFIGMDHFAKPNDELAIAQQAGELHRNFQGYTTQPESALFGFGVTSIGMFRDVFVQHHKKLKDFYRDIDAGVMPIERGVTLTYDDQIRQAVIMELMCQFQLSQDDLEAKYHLNFDRDFNDYFAPEKLALKALEADGLVEIFPDLIKVTPVGRLLIRNIAAVFDRYLQHQPARTFSQSV